MPLEGPYCYLPSPNTRQKVEAELNLPLRLTDFLSILLEIRSIDASPYPTISSKPPPPPEV